jgi:D-alanyl-D-alanine carboxypeptidase
MDKYLIIVLFTLLFNLLLPINLIAYADEDERPSIESEAAVLIDAKTGTVLFNKNSDQSMYPASITKIVTAIIAIEEGHLEDIVTVSQNARDVDGTRVYLEVGEKVTLKKLIQGLLINSGNDAGVAIAEHISGSVEAFASLMNEFAREKIGLKNTTFENPHGLFGENHVSTANDFALITKYALTNDIFTEIIGTSEMEWKGESWDTTIYNHHRMLREWPYEGIIGGKNGYIQQSGHTLVTVAERDGLSLIAVVLKASTKDSIYKDTEELLDYGFDHFETAQLNAGKVFHDKKNVEYQLNDSLFYTKRIGEENVKKTVDSTGKLYIYGEDGRQLLVHQLEKPIENEDSVSMVVKGGDTEDTESSVTNATWGYALFGALVLLGLGSTIIIRNKKFN